jgi:hypothetical protein
MDYKYIKQLLERYWQCETTLEEEEILRMFFSQKDVPAELLSYKDLFTYEQSERKTNVLGDDFDEKILSMIDEPAPVKARVIPFTQRMMPLFKAAAVVAIILTLGNAAQMAFDDDANSYNNVAGYEHVQQGTSVAMGDSAVIDTMQQGKIQPTSQPATTILK